jgi:hypothetical protein
LVSVQKAKFKLGYDFVNILYIGNVTEIRPKD